MSLLEPGSLAWLALAPVIVIFWLLKLRRKDVRVSAGFLWEEAAREARVDSFARRLQANLLLLLQLAALALLALALARPYREVESASSPQVAVLVDTSASMGARRGDSTRFEEARARARRLLEEAPAGAQVLLASYDRTARIQAPFSRDRAAALRALDRLAPRDVAGDGSAGRALAASLLASRPLAEAFLLGDRPPPPPVPDRLRFVDCGGPASNLGFSAFRAARTRDGGLALVAALRNPGPDPEQRDLEIRRGGILVASRRVGVPGRGREAVRFRLPGDGDPVLEARLVGGDALAADDRAWAVVPRDLRVPARVVGPGNLFAERALAAVPGVELERGASADGAPLVLWEAEAPWPPPPGTHILLKVPEALRREAPVPGAFALEAGDSPLVRDVPLADLGVAGLQPLRLPAGAEVLARAGRHEALVLVRSGAARALVFAFDLYRSDLPLSPALPLLFANLVETASGGPQGPLDGGSVPGEPLRIQASDPVQVQLPDGSRQTLHPEVGEALLADTGQAGVYRVRRGAEEWPVALSLTDERESDLSPAPPTAPEAPPAAPDRAPPPQRGMLELWPLVAAGALALLVAEWLLYHRRRS